ncbi:MAG TPA: molybdopterin-dependent oxidoreductase [Candidatus Limnocylindrales bacterium]|nr:molybdopterin-dependent oxidoreductase [Candidatus Limnocylindrales bacterium]
MKAKVSVAAHALNRREFMRLLALAGTGTLMAPLATRASQNTPVSEQLVRFPQKTDLILRTDRPPQLETPLRFFREDLTPNEAFYVRWHLEGIPTSIDLETFRLQIDGQVEKPMSFSLADLRGKFETVSLIAVNQCSGNSRSFFEPRVPGGQWKNGAMGNARWTGIRLRDLLDRVAVKAGAVDVAFSGLDRAAMSGTPNFAKALGVDHARDGETMVAYQMNGAELPMLNGFPLRLVVPGWYGTYWVKALNHIEVRAEKFHGFWMDKAYRIPTSPDGKESPDHLAAETTPIHRLNLRSLFVVPEPGEQISTKTPFEIQGIAFDSGIGIERVEISTDDGETWGIARLDQDLGKYSWRRWRFQWKPSLPGKYQLKVRAINRQGQQQTTNLWNRSGYMRNVIEQIEVEVV